MELRGMSAGKFLNGSMAFFTTGLGTNELAFRAQPSWKLGELKYGWSGAITSSFQIPSSSFAALLGYMPSENPRDTGAASMWSRRWRILAEVPSGATSITG